MPDQDSGEQPAAKSDDKTFSQTPVAVATPEQNEVRNDAQSGTCHKQNEPTKLEKDIRDGERWLAVDPWAETTRTVTKYRSMKLR